MGRMMKKYESGEASQYLTRKQALRKLQLSLKMFRRLCILKGIYPREPKNRKKAQKGSMEKKTLYLKKDVQFLLQEPIVWKLREHKVYLRKKSRARALRDKVALAHVMANKPTYSLDHIVKERSPTFVDALRDMDDCLTLSSLFSTFPSIRFVPSGVSRLCRRLTVEFLHYVIETRALRKVFVSIKGYYFQVEVNGQTITWIVPHTFGYQPSAPSEVDFRIMATFVEFYSTLLGFVNFRLYNSSNICYPPKLTSALSGAGELKEAASDEDFVSERVASLNQRILRISNEDVVEPAVMDEFPTGEDGGKIEEVKAELERINRLKELFSGLKFFLNREVPREALTFVIRSVGGEVSWDPDLFPGASFEETDESITHQILDRDLGETQYLSRYYIQPQWVFDSINARALLPVEKYFQGAVLPPHVSPFITEREGDYVPPEKKKFLDMEKGLIAPEMDFELMNTPRSKNVKVKKASTVPEPKAEIEMGVDVGVAEEVDTVKIREDETKEQYRLRVMMIRNKHKRLYSKMMDSRRRRRKEADKLVNKRNNIEAEGKGADFDLDVDDE